VDHSPGSRDDVANAAAGALVSLSQRRKFDWLTGMRMTDDGDPRVAAEHEKIFAELRAPRDVERAPRQISTGTTTVIIP
jgi:hypothetical protein